MENEIDRLEIVVETEASRATRALGALYKKLEKVANSLEKVMIMAQGGFSFKNVDFDKLLSGDAMKASAKKLGRDLANDLIRNFNLNLAGADVQNQVKSLTKKIAKGLAANSGNPYKGFAEDIEELGNLTAKNGSIAKETADEYRRLYEWINKSGKIKLNPETAKSIGDSYKERSPILKQKMSTGSGTPMDEYYSALQSQFPSILKETGSVEDQFAQLDNAMKHFYDTSKGYEKPKGFEDSAYDSVIEGVNNLATGIKAAKEESSQLSKSVKGVEDTGKSLAELFGAQMDLSGLERANEIANSLKRSTGRTAEQKATRSDLKYPAASLDNLNKKFKDSMVTTDFSSMGAIELQGEISKYERAYTRVKQAVSDMVTLEGTDTLGGKDWYKKIMQMNQYENAIYAATEALGKLNAESKKDFTITRETSTPATAPTEQKGHPVSAESVGYNPEAVKAVFGEEAAQYRSFGDAVKGLGVNASEAGRTLNDLGSSMNTRTVNTFNEQIKRLKETLGELASKGFAEYDPEYDAVARELAEVTAAKKQYDKEMRDVAKSELSIDTKTAQEGINTLEYKIKQLKQNLSDLGTQGYGQGDSEYDRVALELERVTAAKKQYDRQMRTRVKAEMGAEEAKRAAAAMSRATKIANGFKRAVGNIKGAGKWINSVKKSFDKMAKTIANAKTVASKAIHPIKTLKELMGSTNTKQSRRGMSIGRMIGSSIMFSTIFGLISKIKQAIKEGSDNLTQYSSEYNKSISGMVSSLLYMKNAWAVAFAPIINVVGPYISTFIDMIASALNAVGQFMAALTGKGYVVQAKKAWKDYASGLDATKKSANSAEKALKDLQNYTLGIDELNVVQPNDNSGSSGSSGSGGSSSGPSPSEMFETIEVSSSMNKLADMFKDAIAKSDFTEIGAIIGDKLSSALEGIPWESVYHKADNFGKDLATFLNGLISPRLFYDLGGTVANSINTAFHAANAFNINFDWSNLGASLASSITGFFENWDAGLTAETFSNFVKGILESMTSFINTLDDDETFETIGQKLVDFICGIDWAGLTWDLAQFFLALSDALLDLPNDFARGFGQEIIKKMFGEEVELPEISFPPTSAIGIATTFKNIREEATDTAIEVGARFQSGWGVAQQAWSDGDGFFSGIWQGIQYVFEPVSEWFSKKFSAAKTLAEAPFKFIGTWFSERISDIRNSVKPIADWFSKTFQKAYSGITKIFDNIGGYFEKVAGWISKPIKGALDAVRKAVNWIYKKLGGDSDLIPAFATGTNGVAHDTLGVVNDQSGSTYRELVQFPNGKTIIPTGRNVVLPMPKGTKVLPAGKTAALMQMQSMPHFKSGIGDLIGSAWESFKSFTGNVFDYATHPKKLVQLAIDKFTDFTGALEPGLTIAKTSINKLFDSVVSKVKDLFSGTSMDYSPSGGVEQWRELAKKALQMTKQFSEDNLNALLKQMQHESGGNPYAINNWDSNAKKGTPSKGLMQVIDSTFKANALEGYNSNIYDPLSNMLASIRYTVSRYGSLYSGWTARGYKGYKTGGMPLNGEIYVANENGFGSEYIGNIGNRHVVANNSQIVESVSSGVERANDETNALLREVIEYQKAILRKNVSVNMDSKRVDKQISKARNNAGFSFSPT
ncbi:transglycosylase SLT domain-containing protein [[Ruminococcus] lactaris]|nr:transglycosylase SLT domain-containing protein [[Ruminococcus] lactaris]